MIALMLESVMRSVVLILVIWMTLALLRQRNPHLEKTVWITAVSGALAMPFLIRWHLAPAIEVPRLLPAQAVNFPIIDAFTHWADAATVIYWSIACGLVIRFSIRVARVWCIRRNARVVPTASGHTDVRVSPRISSPATLGRTILLPVEYTQWSAEKLAAVMSHERSHVRQRDCYVLWLAHLHACLFWVNPLAGWIVRRLAVLAETTSDDAAILERGDRLAYAEVLLEIASARPALDATVAAAGSNMTVRIDRIVSEIAPVASPKPVLRALCMAALLPVVMLAAASIHMCECPLMRVSHSQDSHAHQDRLPYSGT